MPKNGPDSDRDEQRLTEITGKVIAVIKPVVDPNIEVTGESDLEKDLLMSKERKQNMAFEYSKISKSYPKGISVDAESAGKCGCVNDAIKLVYKKSNGDKS